MSRGESFPNLHGQLDVTGLAFQIYDAPSAFSVRSTVDPIYIMSLLMDSFLDFFYLFIILGKIIKAVLRCSMVVRLMKIVAFAVSCMISILSFSIL